MPSKIWIFSRPVRSGKTTELMHWAESRSSLGGFLVPDKHDLRKLVTLHDRTWYDFEIPAEELHGLSEKAVINISRFYFYADIFFFFFQTLLLDLKRNPSWIVVDEVGKLELKGMGLEPVVGQVIEHFKQTETAGKLLLVVRDELLEQVIDHYGIEYFQVIENLNSIE